MSTESTRNVVSSLTLPLSVAFGAFLLANLNVLHEYRDDPEAIRLIGSQIRLAAINVVGGLTTYSMAAAVDYTRSKALRILWRVGVVSLMCLLGATTVGIVDRFEDFIEHLATHKTEAN